MDYSQTDEVTDLVPQRLQRLEIVRAHGANFDRSQEFPSEAPRKFWIEQGKLEMGVSLA